MSSSESEEETSEETEYVTCHSSESGCISMDTSDGDKKKDEAAEDEKNKQDTDDDGEKGGTDDMHDAGDDASADEPMPVDDPLDFTAEELDNPEPAANDDLDAEAAASSE